MSTQSTLRSLFRVLISLLIVIGITGAVVGGIYLIHNYTGDIVQQSIEMNENPLNSADTITKVLFMFPILASIIVFMRQVLGIGTFGVFAPIVIALSLYEFGNTGYGLLVFVALIGSGVMFKYFITSRFHLPSVAEISLTLSFLAAVFYTLHIAGQTLDLGFNVILFPIIITGFLIEKASDLMVKEGGKKMVFKFVSTLITSTMFGFLFVLLLPLSVEAIAVLCGASVVATVAISQYMGIRLMEIIRFQPVTR